MSGAPVDPGDEDRRFTLVQRRNYLTDRIEAKLKNGWETQWDERERDALTWALTRLAKLDDSRCTEKLCPLVDPEECNGEHCDCPFVPPEVAGRFRKLTDDSVTLNAVGYKLAVAAGLVVPPEPYDGSVDDLVDKVIARMD